LLSRHGNFGGLELKWHTDRRRLAKTDLSGKPYVTRSRDGQRLCSMLKEVSTCECLTEELTQVRSWCPYCTGSVCFDFILDLFTFQFTSCFVISIIYSSFLS
jgi:hypothetical protein